MDEATDECVPCAGGVTGGHPQTGDLEFAFLADIQRALLAEGHDDVTNTAADQGLRGVAR